MGNIKDSPRQSDLAAAFRGATGDVSLVTYNHLKVITRTLWLIFDGRKTSEVDKGIFVVKEKQNDSMRRTWKE